MGLLWIWSWWLGGCAEPAALLDTAVEVSSPSYSTPDLPAEAAIEVFPTNIDFGEVAPLCSERVSLEVRNVGNYPLEILSFELSEDNAGVFDHDGETGILAAGEVWLVDVTFTPQSAKAYTGALLRIQSNDADDWKVDISIQGTGADDEPVIETFTQNEATATDVLWVIDDELLHQTDGHRRARADLQKLSNCPLMTAAAVDSAGAKLSTHDHERLHTGSAGAHPSRKFSSRAPRAAEAVDSPAPAVDSASCPPTPPYLSTHENEHLDTCSAGRA